MRYTESIIFLTEQPAPSNSTEVGRYWVRRRDVPDGEIFPVYVGTDGTYELKIFAGQTALPMIEYRFFGKLPAVQEANVND
jgi:hypothetical protein